MLQLLNGEADAAFESIQRAAEKYPKYLLNLATSMSAQGDIDGAVKNLEQALESHDEAAPTPQATARGGPRPKPNPNERIAWCWGISQGSR